jgi:cytochrome c oxidase cbb3-type subunit 3
MKTSLWKRLNQVLNDSVPVEREKEVMTDHEYDGIKELDNNLPPWWLYGFYLTIVFSVIYMFHYHVLGTGPSSAQEYEAELVAAEEAKAAYLAEMGEVIDENTVVRISDVQLLANAQVAFVEKCAPCHTPTGGGSVGPNLTDEYWIHGGSINDIFRTIKYGVPEKGMIPWQGILTPEEMQAISSWIMDLQGSNPEGGLPPQGELYVSPATDGEQPADTTATQGQ